jgi:hypothetical protein
MTYDFIILYHHQVKPRDEIGISSILIEHVMLCASWAINIPECLSRKVLYLTIVFGLF